MRFLVSTTPSLSSMADRVSVVMTCGYDRSPVAGALLQLLPRDGVDVVGVIMVRELQAHRIFEILRQGGFSAVQNAANRALGINETSASSPVEDYYALNRLQRARVSSLARKNGILVVRVRSLGEPAALNFVRQAQADGLVYCGGGLIRKALIEATQNRILNAHAGPLPTIRGMNAVEWSVMTGHPPCVTIHYIDTGIDTGPPVDVVEPIACHTADDLEVLRQKSLVASIQGLRRAIPKLREPIPARRLDASKHKQYFTMHPALRQIAERKVPRVATALETAQ
jgi:folate-dependent phosphoribosylglycinamide formyltransferase PurN